MMNGLTINEKKSLYNQERVDFLGFTIDGRGILADIVLINEMK